MQYVKQGWQGHVPYVGGNKQPEVKRGRGGVLSCVCVCAATRTTRGTERDEDVRGRGWRGGRVGGHAQGGERSKGEPRLEVNKRERAKKARMGSNSGKGTVKARRMNVAEKIAHQALLRRMKAAEQRLDEAKQLRVARKAEVKELAEERKAALDARRVPRLVTPKKRGSKEVKPSE